MAVNDSLLSNLIGDLPGVTFKASDDFRWSPQTKTVYYDPDAKDAEYALLHEAAHASLQHQQFDRDVSLLRLEQEAWTHAATQLAPRYGLSIDDAIVEAALDSYRDWLHARSRCPGCGQTGLQQADHRYRCLLCGHSWRPNDARRCALRRYSD